MSDVIEGDLGVDPGVVLHLALELVVHDLDGKTVPGLVDALVKLAAEKLERTQTFFYFSLTQNLQKKFFWSLTQRLPGTNGLAYRVGLMKNRSNID